MMDQDPIYVGYEERAPEAVRKRMRLWLSMLALLLAVSLILVVRAQQFDDARFEYGTTSEVEGVFRLLPYPHLVEASGSVVLLVGRGKRSAEVSVEPGTPVVVRGTRITRSGTVMMEVAPGDVIPQGEMSPTESPIRGEQIRLRGEIVGSKCFLGVMNPAHGPVHRACARHCILGGVPPMLATDAGPVLVTGADFTELAGLSVAVTGTRWRLPGLDWISVDSTEPLN